ncbi:MAG: alpha/beta fold hydrolase [Chlamydiota bacterium]|nr:alpha/beta fold hydrolase [Chlamydiota bacterium]
MKKIYFNQPSFDAQLLRVISHVYHGCSDIGECLVTASHIQEGNFESWYEEWKKTAERILSIAITSENLGHNVSAREAYLRSSNYFRTSYFFLADDPADIRVREALDMHIETFDKAAKLFDPRFEAVEIPFENTMLPGYFYSAANTKKPKPTIIANGGYDSTHQEAYFAFVPAALSRGYNVLAFDGPGQGAVLFNQHIPMRYDWEKVISPVIDFLLNRRCVDKNKIALYGPSWGGMLTPRAAAFETRLAALVVNPGQYDALEAIKSAANITDETPLQLEDHIETFLKAAMQDKYVAHKLKLKLFIHGLDCPKDLFEEWKDYNLIDISPKIQCPTFVADSESEPLSKGQALKLYETLLCPKTYSVFGNGEGAGAHCAAGAIGQFSQRVFDWLDETLDVNTPASLSESIEA